MELLVKKHLPVNQFLSSATRGDIFEYCVGKCPFTEEEAKEATRQVTSALGNGSQ